MLIWMRAMFSEPTLATEENKPDWLRIRTILGPILRVASGKEPSAEYMSKTR